jgi:hypothetical protein
MSHVTVPVTGRTDNVPLATVVIPGSLVGPNGELRINFAYSHNNSAGNKAFTITLGGQVIYTDNETVGSLTMVNTLRVRNRGALNSQLVSGGSSGASSEFTPAGFAGVANATFAINMAIDQPLIFFGQLTNGADNLALDSLCVEWLRVAGS